MTGPCFLDIQHKLVSASAVYLSSLLSVCWSGGFLFPTVWPGLACCCRWSSQPFPVCLSRLLKKMGEMPHSYFVWTVFFPKILREFSWLCLSLYFILSPSQELSLEQDVVYVLRTAKATQFLTSFARNHVTFEMMTRMDDDDLRRVGCMKVCGCIALLTFWSVEGIPSATFHALFLLLLHTMLLRRDQKNSRFPGPRAPKIPSRIFFFSSLNDVM